MSRPPPPANLSQVPSGPYVKIKTLVNAPDHELVGFLVTLAFSVFSVVLCYPWLVLPGSPLKLMDVSNGDPH